jgi:vacuolar protein sorting-associated protein 41
MAATTDNLTAPIITESPVSFKSTTLPSSPVGNGAANGNKDVKHPDDTNRTPSSSANGVGITTDLSSSGAKARILTDDEESEEGGEETEDDEEEEGDEDDEDEDEEPTLKYERLGGDANNVLQRDSASALGISSKILVR